jgi:hypothetical protein
MSAALILDNYGVLVGAYCAQFPVCARFHAHECGKGDTVLLNNDTQLAYFFCAENRSTDFFMSEHGGATADKQAEGMAEREREALAAKNREIGGGG